MLPKNTADESIRYSALVPLVLFCCWSCSEEPQLDSTVHLPDKRPNIIFLLADDQRAGTTSAANHPDIRTPNLDRLAADGVVFSNAYSVQPICAPSRFAIFSGQYERTNGLGFSSPYQVTEPQWQTTYPALLRDAGYHTGFIGKFGVEFYTFRGRGNEKFDFWRAHDGWLSFFPGDNPESTSIEAYADATQKISTEIMGEYITEFLGNLPDDKPFNLSVSFSAPHGSVTSSMFLDADTSECQTSQCKKMGIPANQNPRISQHPIYGGLYRDRDISPPADLQLPPYRYLPEHVIGHQKRKQWYDYLYDPETNPEHTIRYLQLITGIDHVVGQLLATLETKDLLENTVIFYSSDHGLLTGEYGVGGKGLLYDLSAKVPLIVAGPGTDKGSTNDALIANIDFAPTILSYAGIEAPATMQGQDFRELTGGGGDGWRSELLLESLTTVEDQSMSEALRAGNRKYIRYFATPRCPYTEDDLDFANRTAVFEQLFDLEADPGERNNLAGDTAFVAALNDMRARAANLSAELTQTSRAYKSGLDMSFRDPGAGCW